MEKSRVYGGLCLDALAVYDHPSSSWKTSQLSLFAEESTWSGQLPNWGMIANGVLYQLGDPRVSEHPTFGNGGSSSVTLPTPTTDQRVKRYKQRGRSTLCAIMEMLPTPNTDQRNRKLLPTPVAHIAKEGPYPSEYRRKTKPLITYFIAEEQRKTIGKHFRLNPRFLEEMMGFPIGWTDLEL